MKKIIYAVLIILTLFMVSGCGTKKEVDSKKDITKNDVKTIAIGNKKLEFTESGGLGSMNFKYPNGAVFGTVGTYSTIAYQKSDNSEDLLFNILIAKFDNKNVSKAMEGSTATYINEIDINGVNWSFYRDQADGKYIVTYACEYNGDTYTITVLSESEIDDFARVFVKTVTFE